MPSSACKKKHRRQRGDHPRQRQQAMNLMRDTRLPGACFPARLGVYWASFISAPPRSSWFASQPPSCRTGSEAGVEAVTDVESKRRQDITSASDADPLLGPVASGSLRYLASIAMTAAATVVAVGVDNTVTIPNLSLVFVVPVIIAGVSLGLGPALCSAILGSLAFNFFLTEPRYSLAVDDAANIWAIGLLFIVGLIVSGVAFTSRQRAAEAALLRRQVIVLQNYGRDVVAADNTNAIVLITSNALAALFQVPVVVMLITKDGMVSLKQPATS